MLPLCSATPTCSSNSQITIHCGLRVVEARCVLENRVFGLSNGMHSQRDLLKTNATAKSLYSEKSIPTNLVSQHFNSRMWSSSTEDMYKNNPMGGFEVKYVEDSDLSAVDSGVADYQLNELTPTEPSTSAAPPPVSIVDSGSNIKSSFEDFISGVSDSFNDSVNKGENAIKSSIDTVTSSISTIIKSANDAVDGAVGKTFSTFDRAGELASNKAADFSSGLKDSTGKAGLLALDVLRRTIVAVEDSLTKGTSFVGYSYQSAKQSLPQEIRDALNLSEDKANTILSPAKIAFQKVYGAIEGLEGSLGLDPNDPIAPFVLVLGTSATLWVFYWVLTYSGYAGVLSPQQTLEILSGNENALLIDIRPEAVRERDGIPDLRRAARFRYASVSIPEVDGSQRNLFKNGRELEDALTAVVIRNLKISQDRSKVIVLDADGGRSKGVARSLQKLGVKQPYLVQGGFRSWVKDGLRVKELKPETALTILKEEAEAILEEIKPSPLQVLGLGVGLIAASYAALEWETTLQYIGVVGIGQTIFRRFATYESIKDLKKDASVLLTPARVGGQAFAWAAAKLETNRTGLPTSPSSSDVQSRVIQAAAKHESQPSDAEGVADQSPVSTTPLGENVDLSEA